MRDIWHHALTCFQAAKVDVPVLCAIGCGAFNDPEVPKIAQSWGNALARCLHQNSYGFRSVIVSLVGPSAANYDAFQASDLVKGKKDLQVPVLLSRDKGMLEIAAHLGSKKLKTGILNPSDAFAVRSGFLGMFWTGRHIALEELLAVQTTLLLQHRDVNPELWETRTIQLVS